MARPARVTAAVGLALSLLTTVAACGESVSVSSAAATRHAPSPSTDTTAPTPSGGASAPTPGEPSGSDTVEELKVRLVPAARLGSGFQVANAWSSDEPPTDPGYFDVATGTAQCKDFMRAFVTADASGGIAANAYATESVNSATAGVGEWDGYFSGDGAQRVMAAVTKDLAACHSMTIAGQDAGKATLATLPASLTPAFGTGTTAMLLRVANGDCYDGVVGRFGDIVVYFQVDSPTAATSEALVKRYAPIISAPFEN
jgi:hypothetical protein